MARNVHYEAVARDRMRFIGLRTLFAVLELSPDNTRECAFEIFGELRDEGLNLTPEVKGYPGGGDSIDSKVVSDALNKVRNAYREESEDASLKAWETPVAVTRRLPGDKAAEYEMPIGRLCVDERHYAEVCRNLGLETYHWPNAPRPQTEADLDERPTNREYPHPVETPTCTGDETGFLPLKEAVNLVVGAPKGTSMNLAGRVLWQKAISSKIDWVVRDCQRDGIHYVHVALCGPVLGGIAMQGFGPPGLPAMSAITAAFLALFGLFRITQRAPPALDEQAEFVPMVRTSPVALEMHPEADKAPEAELNDCGQD